MANEFKPIYYKIIALPSLFWSAYHITDSSKIQYGTKYTASIPNITKDYKGIKKAVLHFAEGAFDTMLWQSMLIWDNTEYQQHTIYEIQPLTNVFKERCMDGIGIYQCGANKIEILNPISLDEMFERAIAEFNQNRKQQIERYPNLDISKIMAAFVHHEQSIYLKNK